MLCHCHLLWLVLQNVTCSQDFQGWTSVCWWQCLEERVTSEDLHCATRKYFEVSATASFNSCYSLFVQSPFPRCYGEFWDDAASHCDLWLMFPAQYPCKEVFWVFRPSHFITGIHMALLLKQKQGTFYVECCVCLLLIIKTFFSSLSLCDLVRSRSGSSAELRARPLDMGVHGNTRLKGASVLLHHSKWSLICLWLEVSRLLKIFLLITI